MFRFSVALLCFLLAIYVLHAYESETIKENFKRVKRQDAEIWDLSQKVKFYCINSNRTFFIETYLGDEQLAEKLDLTKPVAFLVHGWLDKFHSLYLKKDNEGWPVNTAREWVRWVDTNVCGVDWFKLAKTEYLIAAELNTKIVGRYISEFIQMLMRHGVSADDVTIAGHSLGGHVAGFAGQYLNNGNVTLGRIFALDPAGPGFTTPFLVSTEKRLTQNDARFVQALITSAYTLGVQVPVGTANFVANGGLTQPGCKVAGLVTIESATPLKIVCNHFRAVQFFRSSLNPEHKFIGTHCMYHGFAGAFNNLTGLCTSPISDLFGVHTNEVVGNFQLITTAHPPFCVGCLF